MRGAPRRTTHLRLRDREADPRTVRRMVIVRTGPRGASPATCSSRPCLRSRPALRNPFSYFGQCLGLARASPARARGDPASGASDPAGHQRRSLGRYLCLPALEVRRDCIVRRAIREGRLTDRGHAGRHHRLSSSPSRRSSSSFCALSPGFAVLSGYLKLSNFDEQAHD
jgi:hypothetical protein